MSIEVKENVEIFIEDYPYHVSLNKKLIEESKKFLFKRNLICDGGALTNIKAEQTSNNIESASLSILIQWIMSIMIGKYNSSYLLKYRWITRYDKGDYAVSHRHQPAAFAFNYFIKTPKGSSPLVLTTSGKRIKAEEGKIVIFPGNVNHHVPKNNCNGRMTLAGNIYYNNVLEE